jgi:hypothetical protein
MNRYDRSSGQGGETAVDNWLRLPERMNFIANVFRSRQQLAALYERPAAAEPPVHGVPRPALGPVDRAGDVSALRQIDDGAVAR